MGRADRNGMLMLLGDQLIAILVELTDEMHGDARGRWALESRFDLLGGSAPEAFGSLEQAWDWVLRTAEGAQWQVVEGEQA